MLEHESVTDNLKIPKQEKLFKIDNMFTLDEQDLKELIEGLKTMKNFKFHISLGIVINKGEIGKVDYE